MKKVVAMLVWGTVICSIPLPVQAMDLSASSVVLMDAGSGRVLYEHNAHEPRMIASITKLMTALVALDSGCSGEEVVEIQPEWTGIEGSSLYLRAGEQYRLETLLYGLLLQSGNDAAESIAGYCAGTVPEFVMQMNRKAKSLGMINSHFSNPSGLTQEDHYSSAYDMALLARKCLKNELLAEIMATRTITLEGKHFTNHNKLLWRYDGCIGLKTGYTEKAGRTLVSAANRDGLTLICVTLDAPDDWNDHQKLLDYGFDRYSATQMYYDSEMIGFLPVEGSLYPVCPVYVEESASVATAKGEELIKTIELDISRLTAPFECDIPVGYAVCTLNGKEVCRIRLLTGIKGQRDKIEMHRPLDSLREFWSRW